MTSPAITCSDIQISGDVRIHPQAVIAPGVILQATAGCYVAIAAGVCIGAGAVIQAHGGNIEIHSSAIVGAGCLILGHCSVGENVCIGYGSTIFQASILAATLLPPNSLVGDTSRSTIAPPPSAPHPGATSAEQDPWQAESVPTQPLDQGRSPTSPVVENATPPETKAEVISTTPDLPSPSAPTEKAPVVGQVYINQLLMTLFPHQNSLNNLNKPDHP
ncbi:hypothetical protein [Picosynechococcus sp. NKBG15041c]|uniref:hypothetical protein n=1 Tax=Picosynechococcus sp. NKBG15041c TaxID=1407650 RepID=UPI0004156746|nr:hypothetical protein [Picosynechococcus sp. NKBG15041c]